MIQPFYALITAGESQTVEFKTAFDKASIGLSNRYAAVDFGSFGAINDFDAILKCDDMALD